MPKPKRLLLAIFASSLGRNDSGCFALVHEFQPWVLGPRVLAVGRRLSGFRLRNSRLALALILLALPLFSLTRAYVGAPRAYALPSDNLNFQARLETSTGSIAADGYYDIQFNLYSASTGGSSLWMKPTATTLALVSVPVLWVPTTAVSESPTATSVSTLARSLVSPALSLGTSSSISP